MTKTKEVNELMAKIKVDTVDANAQKEVVAKDEAVANEQAAAGGTEAVSVLDAAYWREWLSAPVNMAGALEYLVRTASPNLLLSAADPRLFDRAFYTIETGAHPVLTTAVGMTLASHGVTLHASAYSMRRGQPDVLPAQLASLQLALNTTALSPPS